MRPDGTAPRGTAKSAASRAVWHLILVVAYAGMVAGLVQLYRGMREVLAIGGSCGSGGPYVYVRE
ncbi:MAG TPA: hypothetical protein PLV68_19830, partial [Ilumatobacteraceae bacterium]|nr:hypothetical protein [Ilumatobacteraceae bacterium]